MTVINSVRLSSSKSQAHGCGYYSQLRPLMVNGVPSLGLCVSPSVKWDKEGGPRSVLGPGLQPNSATSKFCFLMSRRKPGCSEICG